MNTWVKSLFCGLAVAILVYLLGDKIRSRKLNDGFTGAREQYSTEYVVRITPRKNDSAFNENSVIRTVDLLSKRLLASGYKYDIRKKPSSTGSENLFDITLHRVTDTMFARNIIISDGDLQIRECYRLDGVPSFYKIMNETARLMFPQPPVEKPVATREQMSPEIRELRDSMDAAKEEEQNENGIRSLIKLSYPGSAEFGFVDENDTAKIGEIFRSEKVIRSFPSDAQYCFGRAKWSPGEKKSEKQFGLFVLRTRGRKDALIQNDAIADAKADFDYNGQPFISLQFTEAGAYDWENLTRQNINHPLAIIVNNEIITAPIVNEAILGGRAQINGGFTMEETQTLAILLKSGRLPARPTILQSKLVKAVVPGSARKILVGLIAFIVSFALAFFIFKTLKAT